MTYPGLNPEVIDRMSVFDFERLVAGHERAVKNARNG